MEVGSGSGYPSSALSNFAPHKFTLDGVECNSMEGFLQGLKFRSEPMQAHVCTLVGKAAKFKGKSKTWYTKQILHWKGVSIKRDSKEYQELLDRAYDAMYEQSEGFKKALIAAGEKAVFKHSIGNTDQSRTVLTVSEFCGRLAKLRDRAYEETNKKSV